jgi:hypothetical protein
MKCPWDIAEEMEAYTRKHGFVSSSCRLTTDEEILLLQMCSSSSRGKLSLSLINRKAFVAAVTTLATIPKDKTLTVRLGKEKPPVVENFDFGADFTILENPKKTMVSAKFFGAAYNRPEEVRTARRLETPFCRAPSSQSHVFCLGRGCIRWNKGPRVYQRGSIFRSRNGFVALRLPTTL